MYLPVTALKNYPMWIHQPTMRIGSSLMGSHRLLLAKVKLGYFDFRQLMMSK
jgi:hypothetical protein